MFHMYKEHMYEEPIDEFSHAWLNLSFLKICEFWKLLNRFSQKKAKIRKIVQHFFSLKITRMGKKSTYLIFWRAAIFQGIFLCNIVV